MTIRLSQFNPKRDGTDDHASFAAMAAEGLRRNDFDWVVEPGTYGLAQNWVLPILTSSTYKRFRLSGYGAVIQSLVNDLTLFDRTIASVSPSPTSELIPTIEGFCLRGQGANLATAGTGISWHGASTPNFKDLQFNNFNKAMENVWCMNATYENIHIQGTLTGLIITNGDGGRIPDGTESNSNSNVNLITGLRNQMTDPSAVGIYVQTATATTIQNCTLEGSDCAAAISINHVSESNPRDRRHTHIDDVHIEFTTTCGEIIRADLRESTLRISDIKIPIRRGVTPNETILVNDVASVKSVIIFDGQSDLSIWNGTTDPWFTNNAAAVDADANKWVFMQNQTITNDFNDAGLWSNGVPQVMIQNPNFRTDAPQVVSQL